VARRARFAGFPEAIGKGVGPDPELAEPHGRPGFSMLILRQGPLVRWPPEMESLIISRNGRRAHKWIPAFAGMTIA